MSAPRSRNRRVDSRPTTPHAAERNPLLASRYVHRIGPVAGAGTVIVVILIIFFLPYLWIVASSLKSQFEIFADVRPLSFRAFVPLNPTLENFVGIGERGVGRAMINSLIVAVTQVVLTAAVCSTAAFALTRIGFRGSNVLFIAILMTFLVPVEALLVPLYRVISGLSLLDTFAAVYLPWLASPFALFILKQAFEDVPRELDEAARVDGAGYGRIFFSIVLPNVKPALATMSLMIFMFSWNSFLWPLVVLQSRDKQLVQVAVAQSVSPGDLPNWGLTFAGTAAATIPLVILFLFLQRYFVQGIASTGIK